MTTICFLAGLGLVIAGVALIFPPAALVLAGLALSGGAWRAHTAPVGDA